MTRSAGGPGRQCPRHRLGGAGRGLAGSGHGRTAPALLAGRIRRTAIADRAEEVRGPARLPICPARQERSSFVCVNPDPHRRRGRRAIPPPRRWTGKGEDRGRPQAERFGRREGDGMKALPAKSRRLGERSRPEEKGDGSQGFGLNWRIFYCPFFIGWIGCAVLPCISLLKAGMERTGGAAGHPGLRIRKERLNAGKGRPKPQGGTAIVGTGRTA